MPKKLTDEERRQRRLESKRKYARKFNAAHPEKVREYHDRYVLRRAARLIAAQRAGGDTAEQQATDTAERPAMDAAEQRRQRANEYARNYRHAHPERVKVWRDNYVLRRAARIIEARKNDNDNNSKGE